MQYRWKCGYFRAKPDIAAEVMNGLKADGRLTAAELVRASEPEDAPLHNEFEWDNQIAAAEYRKYQARVMICNLVIIDNGEDEAKTVPIRAFFQNTNGNGQYEATLEIIQKNDKRASLLAQAFRELECFRRKYESLQELAAVFDAIDEASGEIRG